MINSTNWESIVVDERHIVDAKINRERKTVQCRMFSDKFGPVDFYSENFSEEPEKYLDIILYEAWLFILNFDELENQYLIKLKTFLVGCRTGNIVSKYIYSITYKHCQIIKLF